MLLSLECRHLSDLPGLQLKISPKETYLQQLM